MIRYLLALGFFVWMNNGVVARIDPQILLQKAKEYQQKHHNQRSGTIFSILEQQAPTFDQSEILLYGAESMTWLTPNHKWTSIINIIQKVSQTIPYLDLNDRQIMSLLGKFLFRCGEVAFEFGLHSRDLSIRHRGIMILEKAIMLIPRPDQYHIYARVQLGQMKRISGRRGEAYDDFFHAKRLQTNDISLAAMRVEQGLASYYLMDANQRSSWIKAREHIENAKKIASQIKGETPSDHYLQAYITGQLYSNFSTNNIELAKEAFLVADSIYKRTSDKSAYLQFCENGLAACFYAQGLYLKAIDADLVRLNLHDPSCSYPRRIIKTLSNIGSGYQQIGEHSKNLIFQQNAIDILQNSPITDSSSYYCDIGLAHNNIASSLLDSTERQIYHLEQALEYFSQIPPENRPLSIIQNISTLQSNLAFSYSQTQMDHVKVLNLYDDAITSFKTASLQHPGIPEALANQARIQYLMGAPEASSTLKNAEAFPLDPSQLESKEIAEVYNAIGYTHLVMENHLVSKSYFEKSLSALALKPLDATSGLPEIEDIVERNLGLVALKGLAENLEILGFNQQEDDFLIRGLTAYQKAIDLTHIIRQQQTAQISQVRLSNQSHDIFESAIHLALILHKRKQEPKYLEQAFELAEKSRGLSLLAAISAPGAAEAAGVPDSTLIKQKELQTRYDELKRKKRALDNPNSDLVESEEELNLAMREITTNQDEIAKFLKDNYPKYYGQMYESGSVDIAAIQQDLAEKEAALIEYFYTDSILFTFIVTKDTLMARQKAFTPEFEKQLATVQELQTNKHIHEWADDYWSNAHAVYQFLLGDLPLKLPARLLLIPDDRLNYLAFDALVTEEQPIDFKQARFHELPYLVYDKVISYDYSYTIRQRRQPYRFDESATMLAMAPSFTGETLAQLPMSRAGVVRIGEEFDGITTCLDQAASEDAFIRLASNYDIVDLATHGEMNAVNSSECKLHFSPKAENDGMLHLGEIYNIDLDIRMAVLEACESGMGPNARGEGVMSLARGFSYAGCRTIVTSLWKVPEEEITGDILNLFYKNLAEGMPVDEALTLAKRNYLLQFRDSPGGKAEFFTPFYWSEMVVIGDTNPIPLKEQGSRLPSPLLVCLGIVLFIGLAYFIFKVSKAQKKAS